MVPSHIYVAYLALSYTEYFTKPGQTSQGPGVVASGLTGIRNDLVKCLFILNCS